MVAPLIVLLAIAAGIAYTAVLGEALQHEAIASLEYWRRSAGPGTVVPLRPRPTGKEASGKEASDERRINRR
jgi:hypothetical protein